VFNRCCGLFPDVGQARKIRLSVDRPLPKRAKNWEHEQVVAPENAPRKLYS